MTIRLRIRILLGLLWGFLLVVTTAAALEFQHLADLSEELTDKDLVLVQATSEMSQWLAAHPRPSSEGQFLEVLSRVEDAASADEQPAFDEIRRSLAELESGTTDRQQALTQVRVATSNLSARASQRLQRRISVAESETKVAALGLGVLGGAILLGGVWLSRVVRAKLFDPIEEIDRAAQAALAGDGMRRVALDTEGELGRLADAVNELLDERDRMEGALQGRLRELRAMLTATLRRWPKPAAITGIDGEIMVSTLSISEERLLRELTPKIRQAARTLLSRGFLSAEDLATEVALADGRRARLQSLALGDKRIVGWLAVFDRSHTGVTGHR